MHQTMHYNNFPDFNDSLNEWYPYIPGCVFNFLLKIDSTFSIKNRWVMIFVKNQIPIYEGHRVSRRQWYSIIPLMTSAINKYLLLYG